MPVRLDFADASLFVDKSEIDSIRVTWYINGRLETRDIIISSRFMSSYLKVLIKN